MIAAIYRSLPKYTSKTLHVQINTFINISLTYMTSFNLNFDHFGIILDYNPDKSTTFKVYNE